MQKLLLSIFAVVAVAFGAAAQEKVAPRTEYSVSVSENKVQVKPGQSKELTVSILRSKSFSKAEAKLGLSSTLPEGITVSFAPAEGLFERSVATVDVASGTKEGEYQLILRSTVNNKTKGTVVKVVVTSTPVAADAITAN